MDGLGVGKGGREPTGGGCPAIQVKATKLKNVTLGDNLYLPSSVGEKKSGPRERK